MPRWSKQPEGACTAVVGNRPAGRSLVDTSTEDSPRTGRGTPGRPCFTVGDAPGPRGGPIDALYALALLGSGDPDASQQTVIDAVSRLCGNSGTTPTCPRRGWRFLADHIHLVNESSRGLNGSGPAPFRDAGLSLQQQEVVALRLGGASPRRGARLVGVPISTFGRQLRTGLQALAGAKLPDPACGQPPRESRHGECPGVRP
jgi:hypothetical protein